MSIAFLIFSYIGYSIQAPALPSLDLLTSAQGPLFREYVNAITAYGPGLGVYTPYSYVDVSYDNIPFVGKIPLFGKEGTSSRLGISPFYPPNGNPSNPWPPLYKARPLPLHVPEPQDVVAVPLDEEALHGEPLFPPELVLPGEKAAEKEGKNNVDETVKPENPFGEKSEKDDNDNSVNKDEVNSNSAVSSKSSKENIEVVSNNLKDDHMKSVEFTIDEAREKVMNPNEAAKITIGENDRPKNPFRSRRILMERF